MSEAIVIYCCGCNRDMQCRLVTGEDVYPHREDLHELPFWMCNKCGNFVGCHHKTKNRTKPLGFIPTKEIKNARSEIHKILDPIWQSGEMSRNELYKKISDKIGWKYHTAKIKSVEEAREIYKFVREIKEKQND